MSWTYAFKQYTLQKYKKVAENWIYAVSATRFEVIIFLFF